MSHGRMQSCQLPVKRWEVFTRPYGQLIHHRSQYSIMCITCVIRSYLSDSKSIHVQNPAPFSLFCVDEFNGPIACLPIVLHCYPTCQVPVAGACPSENTPRCASPAPANCQDRILPHELLPPLAIPAVPQFEDFLNLQYRGAEVKTQGFKGMICMAVQSPYLFECT